MFFCGLDLHECWWEAGTGYVNTGLCCRWKGQFCPWWHEMIMPDIIFKYVIMAGLVSLELLLGVQFSTDQILLWVNKQRNIPSMGKKWLQNSLTKLVVTFPDIFSSGLQNQEAWKIAFAEVAPQTENLCDIKVIPNKIRIILPLSSFIEMCWKDLHLLIRELCNARVKANTTN